MGDRGILRSMSDVAAMVTWLGAYLRGAEADEEDARHGEAIARRVLGEDGVATLRAHLSDPARLHRERVGAIHAAIWMVKADREVADAEAEILDALIAHSELPWGEQQKLLAAVREPLSPERIAEELTEPALRELMLGLTWAIARADGRLDDRERDAFDALAAAFDVDEARRAAIRDAG